MTEPNIDLFAQPEASIAAQYAAVEVIRVLCGYQVVRLDHKLRVEVVAAESIEIEKDKYAFGAFVVDEEGPRIVVAGLCFDKQLTHDFAGAVITTLAHELAHYEQWRDEVPLDEPLAVARGYEIATLIFRYFYAEAVGSVPEKHLEKRMKELLAGGVPIH